MITVYVNYEYLIKGVDMKKLLLLFFVLNTIILHAQNFSSVNNDLTKSLNIYCITVSGTDMYIGTNDGVYFSANNNNWVAINKGIELNDVYALTVNGNKIYAGTYHGVFISNDNGQSWQDLTFGLTDHIIVYDLVVNGSVILAACDFGLYRSSDDGISWAKVPKFANFKVECLAMQKSGTSTYIFAGTDVMGIFMSADSGASWNDSNDGVTLIGDEFISSIYIQNDSTIYAGDCYGIMYKSADNGTNWEFIDNNGDVNGYVNGFAYNSTTQELFVGVNDNNLFKSMDDGANWESCSDNVLTHDMNVTSLIVLNENLYAGTFNHGIYKSKLPINPVQMSIISLTGDLNFGDVEIGKRDTTDLSISNKGNKALIIDSISCPAGFNCSWSGTIQPNDFVTLKVIFTPIVEDAYQGTIVVYSNSQFGIDTISVYGVSYKTGANISLSGDLNFGDVEIGNINTKNLSISNIGNNNLRIDSILCTQGFSGNWSGNISSGQSIPVLIIFRPTEAKSYKGKITVYSNAVIGINTIDISGVGIKNESIISLAGNLNFGDIEIGTSASADLTISNDGNSVLNIDSISFPLGFSGNWSGTIASKQNKTISIKFRPEKEILYSGNILVYSNASGGINTISVSGSGITTSVSDPTNISNDILLFPNPTADNISISIKYGLQFESGVHLSIFNSLGIEMKFNPSEGSVINIPTKDFPSGIYYCILSSGTNRITKSFVVVR